MTKEKIRMEINAEVKTAIQKLKDLEKQKNKNNQTVSTNKESNEIIELRQTLEHLNDKVTELTEIKQSVSKRKSPIKAVASIRLRIPFYIKRK